MKRLALLPMLMFGAATALAGDEPPASPAPETKAEQPSSSSSSRVQGELAGVDTEAKLLRLNASRSDGADLGEVALAVDGDALSALGDLKAGDKVSVTCKEGTSGAGCVVTSAQKDPS